VWLGNLPLAVITALENAMTDFVDLLKFNLAFFGERLLSNTGQL
jgi:hypothetical protein